MRVCGRVVRLSFKELPQVQQLVSEVLNEHVEDIPQIGLKKRKRREIVAFCFKRNAAGTAIHSLRPLPMIDPPSTTTLSILYRRYRPTIWPSTKHSLRPFHNACSTNYSRLIPQFIQLRHSLHNTVLSYSHIYITAYLSASPLPLQKKPPTTLGSQNT